MSLRESARIASKSLLAHKTRSLLSMMGIVVGVATVVLVTALVNGMRAATLEKLTLSGTNVFFVYPEYDRATGQVGNITEETVARLGALIFVEGALPRVSERRQARSAAGSVEATAAAIHPRHLRVYKIAVIEGRAFNEQEFANRAAVCLITTKLARDLFGATSPLGRTLRFAAHSYEVIGTVPKSSEESHWAGSADLYVPLTTYLRQEPKTVLTAVDVWVKQDYAGDAEEEILAAAAGAPVKKSLFQVHDPKAAREEYRKTSRDFLIVGAALAGISLLVGGVGIMNMMLISVSERTREVGLRKALGATPRDILGQFLVESALLSGLGGLLGMAFGVVAAWVAPSLTGGDIEASVHPASTGLAFACAVAVGLVFGLFPAQKASGLSPVEALRQD
jgi:putative ABC transport system permease protein